MKNKQKEQLIMDLYNIGAIKFGKFKLKSGKISPYYLDLRFLCSYPRVLKEVASIFAKMLSNLEYDLIVGVPYTGIPIATAIALLFGERMIFARKEAKDYGTQRIIEGVFKPGEKAVIIDDVISDGTSKFEVINPLKDKGLKVKDIVVLVDRGQEGPSIMKSKGYSCHAVIDISDIVSVLQKQRKITLSQVKETQDFLKGQI